MSEPTLIGFSGGRTSGYLLKQIIDAHEGALPWHVKVAFQNTGKEREETLVFVDQCSRQWGVDITWLEYSADAPNKTSIVTFETASRNGEPFEALIRARGMLPNPMLRFCTIDLKLRRAEKYARSVLGWDRWNAVTGIRFDEPNRWAKIEPRNELKKDRWRTVAPLVGAEVTREDVLDWWSRQSFDLGLPVVDGETIGGNCDLCFLKGRGKIETLVEADPSSLDWWIAQEQWIVGHEKERVEGGFRKERENKRMAYFRADRPSYAELKEQVETGVRAPSPPRPGKKRKPPEEGDCACTD